MNISKPQNPASPSGCPMHTAARNYAPFDHEAMYPFFAQIRSEVPIFFCEEIGYWVVTRRADVLPTIRDHERFSAQIATQPLFPWPQKMLDYLNESNFTNEAVQVSCDQPRHTRVRTSAQAFLNIKRFASYEADLRALVRGYLDRIEGRDEVNLVDALTYEFPAQVVFLLLGERNFDPLKIKAWGDLRLNMIWGKPSNEELETGARDLAEFWDYAVNLVEARKEKPGDDYASFLLEKRNGDDAVLSANEICSLVFGLLLAGHETTTNAAGNLLLELLSHPDQWWKLVEIPSLIPNAVEEGLRFASSVVGWRRIAKQDVTIAGVNIPKGSKLFLAIASANHDEDQFDNPERFDVERPNARDHIAFGNGIHHCLGAPLARLELRIILEEMTARFPYMKLSENQDIAFTQTISFRGPSKLMVRPKG